MLDNAEAETQDLSDEQIDELVSKAENPSREAREIPMSEEKPTPTPSEEFEITHQGKAIKATRDQLIKWAQQGYDYPQKAQKFNQEKAAWEQNRIQWEQKWGNYKKIDDWAANNPDQWLSFQENWKKAQQPQAALPGSASNTGFAPYISKIQMLEERLQQFEPVVNQVVERFTTQEQQSQDQQLDQEIKSIQEKYKDLDFSSPDESGKSLEFKVLEHAQKNGIRNFSTAFKDFYHDELIARAEAQAKQNVSKDIQAKSKMGILGKTPTPIKGIPAIRDVKKQSYEDIMAEIREERSQGLY